MATKRDPNRYAVMCYVSFDTLAKIRTVISGKKVTMKSAMNKRPTACKRAMCVSDFMIACTEQAVSRVKPSLDAVYWCGERRRQYIEARRIADASVPVEDRERQTQLQLRAYYKRRLEEARSRKRNARRNGLSADEIAKLDRRIEELDGRYRQCAEKCSGYEDRRTRIKLAPSTRR